MDIQKELERIQSLLLSRISSAATGRDVAAVAALSGLAKECEALKAEFVALTHRVEATKSALKGASLPSSLMVAGARGRSGDASTTSRKAAGAQARSEWLASLRTLGIHLSGHGKRYQSARGESVGVAFANELPKKENRWFLGLSDEPTDVAVLICKSLAGKVHDIVLPVSRLREVWRALSRHQDEVKFNVKREAARFLLLVPGTDPLDVTTHVGNHEPLR